LLILLNSSKLCTDVVDAIRAVVGDGAVPLHVPRFGGKEADYLLDCLDSTFVSSVGEYVNRFESDLAIFTGAKHVVAVVNGTAALHIALLLAGVQPGDEVFVPALTFVATANAISYCHAYPHFVDSDIETLGMSASALREHMQNIAIFEDGICTNRETGRVIRAILPMHAFGCPADIESLRELANEFNLVLIEDAAESLGSYFKGKHTGTFGPVGTLSFNGNKIVTTGGGGALLIDDPELARKAKHLTTTAKVAHRWEFVHDQLGYNYRMPNINAALGCAQLEQLPVFLAQKRALHDRYKQAFASVDGIRLWSEPAHCTSNYWLQSLLLDEPDVALRDAILAAANDAGLMTRPAWMLMHELPMYAHMPRAPLPVAQSIADRLINIPSSAGLGVSV
jgi:perosamine synthetase